MKIAIDVGHNVYPDLGAVGIRKECELNLNIATNLIPKLHKAGFEVVQTKPSTVKSVPASLQKRVKKANESNCDYFVSIHHNAFNGSANGAEVYAISKVGKNLATEVLNEILKLGFKNRGVKDGSNLYVVRQTNMPAILIESGFVDSEVDMQLWNGEAIANAIFNGIKNFLK